MFWKTFAMESSSFFQNDGDIKALLCKKKKYFANLSGGQYLFKILHILTTVKTSKNVVKSECFWKLLQYRALLLL